ncbi:MAG TPA: sensor histidine kinase, partial [Ilumatobacteraceae bacterium]
NESVSRTMPMSRAMSAGRVAGHQPVVATGLGVAVVLGVAAVAEAAARAVASGATARYAFVLCVLALCTTVPLTASPTAAAIAVTAATVLSLAVFRSLTVAGAVAEVVVLYRFGRTAAPNPTVERTAAALSLPFLVLALSGHRPGASQAALLTVVLAAGAPAAAWVGIARRASREALVQSTAREIIAGDLIEHTARGERARIARELHDVVAHHISMVAVQAETARLTTAGMPAAGAQKLSAIGDTARTALTEMRRLLGVLREDAEAPDLRPQPGLGQLNDLVDEARDATGSGTRLILRGSPVALDPGVELAAYRIAQEALTNARRHAAGAAVDVELHYGADRLHLRIRDNGPGPVGDIHGGHGLTGMRERAAAVGGHLRTGPAAGGGFLVEASLPATAEAAE